MCMVHFIHKYDCHHHEISSVAEESRFCLFDRGVCSASDLGRYRVYHVTMNKYCMRCQTVANSMRMYAEQWKDKKKEPSATVIEKNRQLRLERDLSAQANMPLHMENPGRANQLNLMVKRNLQRWLNREVNHNPQAYADIVRYIASLPRWLNRRGLVESLRPWFAQLFDEELQLSLRPTLKFMYCEDMFDDLMVWTSRDLRLDP
ncbi:hypothetical protein F4811DRAFT_327765 [Daldinia bambusicola]|nr:hypothetical protein F4811DRAFT_327765 [Daldinia bambusicola]